MRWLVLVVLSCMLFASALEPTFAAQYDAGIRVTRLSEYGLRSKVVSSALPNLSGVEALQGKSPIVTEITVSGQGHVLKVVVLEAPSQIVAEAMQRSISEWKFTAVDQASHRFIGKLTFYLTRVGGKTVVVDPSALAVGGANTSG